jgi:hypothetical protein
MTGLFLSLGFAGVLGMTVLFPLLGYLFYRRPGSSLIHAEQKALGTSDLVVLIPAHDDLSHLKATLESFPGGLKILVGLDSCTDGSAEYLKSIGVEFKEYGFKSKWKVLQSLVQEVSDKRIAFVDAGTIWPQGLLEEVNRNWESGAVMAVAPTYRPENCGRFEKIAWWVESSLKRLENRCGGPVAVHGATIFYSSECVKQAFHQLKERPQWRNDDVILPLCMRLLYPQSRIQYLASPGLQDQGIQKSGFPMRRRLRMVAGNVEVANWVFFHSGSLFSIPHLLFLRRVARMFWAYDLLFFAIAFLSLFKWKDFSLNLLAVGGVSFLVLLWLKRDRCGPVVVAWLASFISPVFIFSNTLRENIKW